jgi:FKBP-type peptidyl-prolyl cis-trans isomerase
VRFGATLFVVLGLTASLAACSPAEDAATNAATSTESGSTECVAESGKASDAVTAEGKFGSEPVVSFDFPIEATTLERTVLIDGDGETVASGDSITVDFVMYNATSGEEVSNTGFVEGSAPPLTVSETSILAGLAHTLQCSTVGSRVVGVIPPAEMWGETGSAELGIAGTDSVVMVADVVSMQQPLKPAVWTEQVPEVDFSAEVPVVTLAEGIPAELQLAVLKEGDGAVVKTGQTVTVDYQGTSWDTGEVFDQSYGKEPASFPTDAVIEGFRAALVGQKIGSTVIVSIPAEYGYGTDAAAHELGGQTLVFLVEIQDAQ